MLKLFLALFCFIRTSSSYDIESFSFNDGDPQSSAPYNVCQTCQVGLAITALTVVPNPYDTYDFSVQFNDQNNTVNLLSNNQINQTVTSITGLVIISSSPDIVISRNKIILFTPSSINNSTQSYFNPLNLNAPNLIPSATIGVFINGLTMEAPNTRFSIFVEIQTFDYTTGYVLLNISTDVSSVISEIYVTFIIQNSTDVLIDLQDAKPKAQIFYNTKVASTFNPVPTKALDTIFFGLSAIDSYRSLDHGYWYPLNISGPKYTNDSGIYTLNYMSYGMTTYEISMTSLITFACDDLTCQHCQNNMSICEDCYNFQFFDSNLKKCSCYTGYFFNGSFCQECSIACKECINSFDNCSICQVGYIHNVQDQSCKCSAGRTLDLQNGKCSCRDGQYYEIINDTCYDCYYTCKTCLYRYPTACELCQDGLTFDLESQQCICPSGKKYNNISNICECPIGEYFNEDVGFCQKCHQYCSDCFGGTNFQCRNCIIGLNFTKGSTCDCTNGMYYNFAQAACTCQINQYYETHIQSCESCHPTCYNCTGGSQYECDLCLGDQIKDTSGQCLCQNSNTFDMITQSCGCLKTQYLSGGICKNCHPSCQQCYGGLSTQCASCPTSAIFNKTTSSCNCVAGTMQNSYTYKCDCIGSQYYNDLYQKCTPCHSSCNTCYGASSNQCLSCKLSMIFDPLTTTCSCKSGMTYNGGQYCECVTDQCMAEQTKQIVVAPPVEKIVNQSLAINQLSRFLNSSQYNSFYFGMVSVLKYLGIFAMISNTQGVNQLILLNYLPSSNTYLFESLFAQSSLRCQFPQWQDLYSDDRPKQKFFGIDVTRTSNVTIDDREEFLRLGISNDFIINCQIDIVIQIFFFLIIYTFQNIEQEKNIKNENSQVHPIEIVGYEDWDSALSIYEEIIKYTKIITIKNKGISRKLIFCFNTILQGQMAWMFVCIILQFSASPYDILGTVSLFFSVIYAIFWMYYIYKWILEVRTLLKINKTVNKTLEDIMISQRTKNNLRDVHNIFVELVKIYFEPYYSNRKFETTLQIINPLVSILKKFLFAFVIVTLSDHVVKQLMWLILIQLASSIYHYLAKPFVYVYEGMISQISDIIFILICLFKFNDYWFYIQISHKPVESISENEIRLWFNIGWVIVYLELFYALLNIIIFIGSHLNDLLKKKKPLQKDKGMIKFVLQQETINPAVINQKQVMLTELENFQSKKLSPSNSNSEKLNTNIVLNDSETRFFMRSTDVEILRHPNRLRAREQEKSSTSKSYQVVNKQG